MPRIIAVETAVPEHRYTQAEVLEICKKAFGRLFSKNGRAEMFARSGVETRYLSEPAEYYLADHPFSERNGNFLQHALRLSESCIRRCLTRSGKDFADIGHLLSVTTTGLLTPSLEAHLAQTLPFRRTMKRTPIFGVGCAGGAVGLSRAADYLGSRPSESVILLSVELCSLTFRMKDQTMTQLVGATLFGDGACALLMIGDEIGGATGIEILGSRSFLIPNSLDVMGWDFDAEGMRLVLSSRAPSVIERHMKPAVESFLADFDLNLRDVKTFLFHPGSSRILDSCMRALHLTPNDTRYSRRFLSRYGNLSSASLPFILKDALEEERPAPNSLGLVGAFGPGFSCELSLLRFP